jgi:plastocyanin
MTGGRALTSVLAGGLLAGGLLVTGCTNTGPIRPPAQGPTEAHASIGPGGVQQVVVNAGDDLRFSPAVVDVTVGRIRLTLRHSGHGAPHTLYAADVPGLRVPLVRPGDTQSVQFTASRPGRYRFVCTIHEAQGQTGTLVVVPR